MKMNDLVLVDVALTTMTLFFIVYVGMEPWVCFIPNGQKHHIPLLTVLCYAPKKTAYSIFQLPICAQEILLRL